MAFVCDGELAADLALRTIERMEKQAAELAEARSRAVDSGADEKDPEAAKETRRAQREQARAESEAARSANLDLGRKLLARRGAKSRKDHGLARAQAIAALVLSDNSRLPAAGLRLVLPQLQEVGTRRLKSGERRERVEYHDSEECRSYLANRIAEASSANEVLELLADALVAALACDERELAQSRRIGWHSPARGDVEKLLAADIRAVRPRGRRARR